MKLITAALILSTCFFTACSNADQTAGKGKDKYDMTKDNLEATEKKSATRFIEVSGHDKRNFFGQTVIKGTLTNKAKVVTYKDVDVELAFYSKTGALLEKDHEVIFETIAPGDSKNFKTKYFGPKGTDSVAMKVISAKY